ncbi:MAG: methionine--tRNA ligase [Candidatus Aenigmatarchaeota archaeon]
MVEFKTNRITVTSALPYVNGVKHLGNIVGSILPADVFHRFLDLLGVENIFICGTDDHGTAVEIAALREGLEPKAYADKYYSIQKEIYEKWGFDFTFFGRTSSKSNHEITKEIFLAIYKNGYIKQQTLLLPFCNKCKIFLPDRFVTGVCPKCGYDAARGDQCESCGSVLDPIELKNPRCVNCRGCDIEFKEEDHLFLDLSKLENELKKWISKNEWHDNVRNLALGWIREGLKPRCITRNLKWGINVPLKGYENLVFYVWFDAPIGYISITKDAGKKIKDWWIDSKIYHFLGKDNIPFHTIIWPGMLIASKKYSLPHYVAGYEYLNWECQKFSTSRGVGLFSDEVLDLFPADYWRFYLSSILPENRDSNFDWDDFRSRINNELIANYGNLFYRATHFIEKNFSGKVPKASLGKREKELLKKIEKKVDGIEKLVEDVRLKDALKEILSISDDVNRYFQDKRPWETISKKKNDCATTLYFTVNVLRIISTLLYPYMPAASVKALNALNSEISEWKSLKKFSIKPGHKIKAELLFKKIEDKEIESAKSYKTKYAKGTVAKDVMEEIKTVDDMIPFNEFKKVDMRVGTITDVADHPNGDKLFVLQVDLGSEKRQLVAGLRGIYKKEEMKGKQVIVVCNLEPKELRGVKSHGMLLASENGTILTPQKKVANGSKVM